MYIPEEAIDLAMNRGYTVTLCPRKGVSMQCGDRHIWKISEGFQTADLINRAYRNHQTFDTAIEALNRPF